jgi:hypothetical protein
MESLKHNKSTLRNTDYIQLPTVKERWYCKAKQSLTSEFV